MTPPDLVSVLEAAYAIDGVEDEEWVARLVREIRPLVPRSLGTVGFLYDSRERPMRTWAMVNDGSPLDPNTAKSLVSVATDDYIDNSWKKIACGTAAEVPGFDEQVGPKLYLHPLGVRDAFTINAYNPVGVGCSIGCPLAEKWALDEETRALWTRVSAHVAAAFRLRLRLRESEETPAAVLSPSGKVLHAERGAELESSRSALAAATSAIEHARGKLRRSDPEAALSSWRALVSARWTLVDQFEKGGQRFVIARSNEVTDEGKGGLTRRERQVVALASLGHHSKLIAYELGISYSTVRVLLARAARRLGARSRDELLRKFEG